VVVIIITTVVAAAIPILTPTNDDRRLREAARTLNTFITAAQSQAIALGRPYGIALKRLSADTGRAEDNGVCLEVFYVEQAPPYTGFDVNSHACLAHHPDVDNEPGMMLVRFVTRGPTSANLPAGWTSDVFPADMIRPGDVIEINGKLYELVPENNLANIALVDIDPDPADSLEFFQQLPNAGPAQIVARPLSITWSENEHFPLFDSGEQIKPEYDAAGFRLGNDRPDDAPSRAPAPYWTEPASYRILRQATLTSDEPYQLPEGTAIDLRASGVGSDNDGPGHYFYVPGDTDNDQHVSIMFAPEGRVSRVSFSQLPRESKSFDDPVVENVFLLVGKRENVPAPAANVDPTLNQADLAKATTDEQRAALREPVNWLNGNSRWIVVGSQSGRIATIENAAVNLDPIAVLTSSGPEEKRNQQILAAREFTREMSQVGGR
jgi:hypothetical protein